MAATWDRLPRGRADRAREAAVRRQVVELVATSSPFWRERLTALGRTPSSAGSLAGLATLLPAGERDVCPDGDPSGAAALVLQLGEGDWALHAEGPRLRAGLLRRLARPGSYRALIEADTRPTLYVWAGLGLRFPVASTRSDLDVVARAGARLWQVLGLTRGDVVVSALPTLPTGAVQALQLGALGAGCPLLVPGPRAEAVAGALALVPATVLVVPAAGSASLVRALSAASARLGAVTTVLVVGAPSPSERSALRAALDAAGCSSAVLLAVHVPEGHRLAWGECRAAAGPGATAAGLHTYPDLEVVSAVDPETGETPDGASCGELVLTQLGLQGSAMLRWRTGDLVDEVTDSPCPACGRTVPRVVGLRRGGLVPRLALSTGARAVDLRAVASALTGRTDVQDWRVVLRRSRRSGADQLLVHLLPDAGADAAAVALGVGRDVRTACGQRPTQVVVEEPGGLPEGGGPTRRVLR